MTTTSWAITDDVPNWVVVATATLLVLAIALLVHELSSRRQRSWLIFSSGVSNGRISAYTDNSRRRRAISCVNCEPKSRTTIV